MRGKRGHGTGGKTIVFGIFKRNSQVYTEIVPSSKKTTLSREIRGQAVLETVIHSDASKRNNGLVDLGYSKHFRVLHNENEFANRPPKSMAKNPFGVMQNDG